ncbi:hypothetical protein BCR39DRAFT_479444 [Naematelia encephala]|uniref:COQ9 domain-containing protein n=1 Tax=Naematelia encephala TaxID=71784 RepID=A0A1Y2BAP3_9TREE|nr:hypothetical protein BCR39DRAFT_479444 [Naematelia encephala]
MSLRATILSHSLPHLPTHSFTRSTLVHALTALPPSHPDYREPQVVENAIDTIFGPGNVGAAKALVEAWEDAGRDDMTGKQGGLKEILQRRLEWSAAVGEHLVEVSCITIGSWTDHKLLIYLVSHLTPLSSIKDWTTCCGGACLIVMLILLLSIQAYANLSTPTSPPSIPLPSLPTSLVSRLLTALRPPPLYSPPSSSSSSSFSPSPSFSSSLSSTSPSSPSSASSSSSPSSTSSSSSTSSLSFSSFLSSSQLALITINPLGPFSYAFRIADTAMTANERLLLEQQQQQSNLRRGAWGEPLGAGSEWYISRAGLGIVYLIAESNLLRPMPSDQPVSRGINPYLPQAIESLETGIDRYNQVMNTLENSEQGLGEAAGYLGFLGRSLQGIIRSRGL